MGGVNILHTTASLAFLVWCCLMFSTKSTCHGRELSSSYHPNGFRHFMNRLNALRYYVSGRDDVPAEGQNCGVIPKVKVKQRSREPGVASFGQIPWQAGIFDKKTNTLMCSGTLVSADFVLTSAVCTLFVTSLDKLEIRLGDWDISDKEFMQETYDHLEASVTDVLLYPDGPIGEVVPVLALLKLQNPVDFSSYPQISPICIPPLDFCFMESKQPFDYCLVSGWGFWNHDDLYKASDDGTKSVEQNDVSSQEKAESKNARPVSIRIPISTNFTEGQMQNSIDTRSDGKLTKDGKVFPNTLSIDSSLESRDSGRKPHASSSVKLPDPLDYAETSSSEEQEMLAPWNENDDSSVDRLSNALGPQNNGDDEYLKHPAFDFIPDSYEANIHHNRRKYNLAKAKGNLKPVPKSTQLQNDPLIKLLVESSRTGSIEDDNNYIGKQRLRRLYQSHAERERESQLKLFKVEAHENCQFDSSDSDQTSTMKYCVSPTSGVFVRFACMVDFGSPVFCVSSDPVTPGKKRRIKRFKPFIHEERTRAYLVGFVSDRNPQCFHSHSDDSHSGQLNRAEFIPFDKNIIRFVHENI